MMNQTEMFNYLKKNLTSHTVEMEGNKILGKRLIKSRSFSNFKITFLKNKNEVSITTYHGRTLRYNNHDDLFCLMGAFSYIKTA